MWVKPLPDGRRLLRTVVSDGTLPEFAVASGDDELRVLQDAQWLDADHSGRALFTRDGSLWVLDGAHARRVADLSGGDPDPQPAPAWATRWSGPPEG